MKNVVKHHHRKNIIIPETCNVPLKTIILKKHLKNKAEKIAFDFMFFIESLSLMLPTEQFFGQSQKLYPVYKQ